MYSISSRPTTSAVRRRLSQRLAKCGAVLALVGSSAAIPSGSAVAGSVAISTGVAGSTPPCSPSQLSAAPLQGTSEALVPAPQGGFIWQLDVTNEGSQACTISGWPSLEAVSESGAVLDAVSVQEASSAEWGQISVEPVTIAPGASAAAFIQQVEPLAGCPTNQTWGVQASSSSGGSSPITMPTSIPSPCAGSELIVSPLHPSTVEPFSVYPSAASPPAAVVPAGCPAGTLSANATGEETVGAAAVLTFTVENSSTTNCGLELPWPSVVPNAAGTPGSVGPARDFVAQSSPPVLSQFNYSGKAIISIPPGAASSFALIVPIQASSASCPSVGSVSVVFNGAGETNTGVESASVPLPSAVLVCAGTYVTPVVAGTDPVMTAPASGVTPNSDGPAGFFYGLDSSANEPISGTPFKEPMENGNDGNLGGYMGEVGDWHITMGCGAINYAWAPTAAQDANTNYYTYNDGVGTGFFWMMGGPGTDPSWDGTENEAHKWGAEQANNAAQQMSISEYSGYGAYPVLWMDIETDNGWLSTYNCSGYTGSGSFTATQRRWVMDGFWNCVSGESSSNTGGVNCTNSGTAGRLGLLPGIYSAPGFWNLDFSPSGLGSGTEEWTFQNSTKGNSSSYAPQSWTSSATVDGCIYYYNNTTNDAYFFGGQSTSSATALMWQWSGGDGCSNSWEDMDQIDTNRMS